MRSKSFRIMLSCLLIFALCAVQAAAEIKVYFLDVGQADAALIQCDGMNMLIDAGNWEDSGFIYSFLYDTMGIRMLDYVVATHPHEDHIGGMEAALSACSAKRLYSPVTYDETEWFAGMLRSAEAQDLAITVPAAGETFELGGAAVQFISPNEDYGDWNNDSLCVRIVYGSNSFLFAADAQYPAEAGMLGSGFELGAQVLKVGHHGSDSSSSEAFLRAVMPEYAVLTTEKDNMDGNPDPEVLCRFADIGAAVLRTDELGMIVCTGDGEQLSFAAQADADLFRDSPYIGSFYSKKFHLRDCESVADMMEHNKVYFSSREAALEAGYVPCKRCRS